jgi:hypothetical protein
MFGFVKPVTVSNLTKAASSPEIFSDQKRGDDPATAELKDDKHSYERPRLAKEHATV